MWAVLDVVRPVERDRAPGRAGPAPADDHDLSAGREYVVARQAQWELLARPARRARRIDQRAELRLDRGRRGVVSGVDVVLDVQQEHLIAIRWCTQPVGDLVEHRAQQPLGRSHALLRWHAQR